MTEAPAADDWRRSVLQSYRNQEVREIAKVLAALEPGATTSAKLMLAMRFEDTIFKSASSLADYRKRLTKRLKKTQKNYVPPSKDNNSDSQNSAANADATEILLLELRRKYGDSLKYIAKNAAVAIQDLEERSGKERAMQLQKHTDVALEWTKELGIWEEAPVAAAVVVARVSEAELRKLQEHLERRVENIRTYCVKHADPDLFLQETLERKDVELAARANKFLGLNLSKCIQQVQQNSMAAPDSSSSKITGSAEQDDPASLFDAVKLLQESLDRAETVIPLPTRNNSNDIPAAVMHLDKIRAASTALMAYFSIPDRQKTAPRNALPKIFSVTSEGMQFVRQVSEKLPKPTTDEVSLHDAWTKVLELPLVDADMTSPALDVELSSSSSSPVAKRPRLSLSQQPQQQQQQQQQQQRPFTKSRVLLTPNRRTPSHLVPALARKRAKLVRPPHASRGSHLILEFGTAFTMTIYFSPLLVALRAMEPNSIGSSTGSSTGAMVDHKSTIATTTTTQLSTKGCATWIPLYHGLTHRNRNNDLSVWGVTEGSYEMVGRVVEERLRDASMQATHVLRRCFRNHVKDKTSEFEVEILEISALLEFLQLARTTYMPNWQDDEGT